MHQVQTRIDIDAPAETVWSLLTDFAAYPRWNPFVRSIAGPLEPGRTLEVFVQPPGSKGMRFRPKLLAVVPRQELRWKGQLLVPGLFDGEHSFRIEARAGGGVVFHHGERFTGLLVPLMRKALDGGTRDGFLAMNSALKREAEGR